jgi:hypothetical protein
MTSATDGRVLGQARDQIVVFGLQGIQRQAGQDEATLNLVNA